MRLILLPIGLLLVTLAFVGCATTPSLERSSDIAASEEASQRQEPVDDSRYLFGWGSVPSEVATPRGGTTRGASVVLDPPRPLPLESISSASDQLEKDRAAILSLAGDYKTSFHFLETLGLYPDHEPDQPYYSWTTEHIRVVEDSPKFISLQHILVAFFQEEDGSIAGPMVMKHWRQDWTYEDTDLHVYRGARAWARERRSPESVEGEWSQRVWQVDDSPRYEVLGRWTHDGNRSMWTSDSFWRPLPRREYTKRDDYDVTEGVHRIIITPNGWLHEQNNWKRAKGETDAPPQFRAHEIGLDRYERISSPSLEAAAEYWKAAAPYWRAVRQTWEQIFAERDSFALRAKVDGLSQFERHFENAAKLEAGEPTDVTQAARETVDAYLAEAASAAGY